MKSMKYETDNKIVLNNEYINDCIVFDLETDSKYPEEANLKWFGAYSYKHKKYFICDYNDSARISQLMSDHRITIGFNNKTFDNPIMLRMGYDVKYKIIFDCYRVLWNPETRKPNRLGIIQLEDGTHLDSILKSKKLRDVAKALDIPSAKGDIDYKIFRKDSWTDEEIKEIEHYLFKDIEVTRLIFEFLITYFDPFKKLLPKAEVKKFNHVRSSTGSFAYSAICHAIDKTADYPEFEERKKQNKYEGGYVLEPVREYSENVLYLDFASLYPHIMMMCNLFSVSSDGWNGDGFFETFGTYNNIEWGKTEQVIKNFYDERNRLKKEKNPLQLAYKIVINTVYGDASKPIFLNLFNPTIAKDTTFIGRQIIKYAIQTFKTNGLNVIAADTDSCFVEVDNTSKQFVVDIADKITETIKSHVPFPVDTFKFKIDAEIDKIWFPKQKKKHYAYLTSDKKFKVTGLDFIKGDATLLGQKMHKYLKPIIEQREDCKFDKSYLSELAMGFIKEDISLVGRIYRVKSLDEYKTTSSIQAQISEKFGEGEYLMIPNLKIRDVGKSKLYCSADKVDQLTFDDIVLDKFWKEMEVFTK